MRTPRLVRRAVVSWCTALPKGRTVGYADSTAQCPEETTGYLEFALMGHGDIASFAIEHAGHDLQVISQYGEVYQEPPKEKGPPS